MWNTNFRIHATEAFEIIEEYTKDGIDILLVISDWLMPGMKGDRLAKEILAIRPDIPIILCTGFTELFTEEHAKSIGVRKFLMKPMSMADLSKGIREALGQTSNN